MEVHIYYIFNFKNMSNVDNSKSELLFDKVEAFATGETLLVVDVIYSSKRGEHCYELVGAAHYWWCRATSFLNDNCDKPFNYI